MVGWNCPHCGESQVCSVFEFRAVYHYRAAIKDAGRRLINRLSERGVAVRAGEDGVDAAVRWATQGRDAELTGPRYICANCRHPWTNREVPA